jgi:hypothetical protein
VIGERPDLDASSPGEHVVEVDPTADASSLVVGSKYTFTLRAVGGGFVLVRFR